MEGDNVDDIKRLTETLTHASHAMAQAMYQQTGPTSGPQPGSGASDGHGSASSSNNDEVVDAEYEEVK